MHFFIDTDNSNINNQVDADAFGPDVNNPTNKYNVTSRLQLSGKTKAFACQKGLMIVQQSSVDSTLVNLIIKPIEGLKVPFSSIKYYVYRGLLKSDFINGTSVTLPTANSNEFITSFWDNWNNYKTDSNQPTLPNPSPESFGFDSSLPGTLNIESIYNNSQTDIRAIPVNEGMWIGNFGDTHKIGFEIITEADSLNLDLDFLRVEKFQIDVTSLTGLQLRATREQILSFVDPAAFFGLHYDVGVSISTYSGNIKTTVKKKQNDVYTLLLDNKFATKNRVYLDIRSEKGYSYNFYQNYDDGSGSNIKIGNSVTTPTAQSYSTNDWPIIFIDVPLTTTESKNDTKINIRIDDNIKPILFFKNTNILGQGNRLRFINEKDILNGTSQNWSKDLIFLFPNTGSGVTKDNIAYYIKLQYFRQVFNPVSPDTVLKNEYYFNSAFCPIDLSNIADTNYTFQTIYNDDLYYVRGMFPGQNKEFGYTAENGAIWDTDRIVFYSQNSFQYKNSGNSTPPVPSFATNPGINLDGKFSSMSFKINNDISVLVNKINESQIGNVDILKIIHYSGLFHFKEDMMLLGITQSEFQTIKSLLGLNNQLNRYLFLDELTNSPFTDTNGISFRKFEVKLQGLNSNGLQSIVSPTTPIYVYTKDGFTFSSRSFGSMEDINDKIKISRIYDNIKVFEWTGYIDDSREAGFIQLLEETCVTIPSIFPSLLFTISIGEGLNIWIDDNYDSSPPHNIMLNNSINGFDYLGTDDFGGEFSRYQPFLPSNYNEGDEFTLYPVVNEHQPLISAVFKDLASGLLGTGAVIAQRKSKFLSDASGLGYVNPNIDQIVYWIYVYYQGEGNAKAYLISNKGFNFTKKPPEDMTSVRNKALKRLATWRYIKTKNILSK